MCVCVSGRGNDNNLIPSDFHFLEHRIYFSKSMYFLGGQCRFLVFSSLAGKRGKKRNRECYTDYQIHDIVTCNYLRKRVGVSLCGKLTTDRITNVRRIRISMTMIRPSLDVVYGICRGLPSNTCICNCHKHA